MQRFFWRNKKCFPLPKLHIEISNNFFLFIPISNLFSLFLPFFPLIFVNVLVGGHLEKNTGGWQHPLCPPPPSWIHPITQHQSEGYTERFIIYYRKYTVCPRSSDPFNSYKLLYKRATTSWTYCILQITQPSKYIYTQLQYRCPVISEAPSIVKVSQAEDNTTSLQSILLSQNSIMSNIKLACRNFTLKLFPF